MQLCFDLRRLTSQSDDVTRDSLEISKTAPNRINFMKILSAAANSVNEIYFMNSYNDK